MSVTRLPTAGKIKRIRFDTPKIERVPMPTARKAKRPKADANRTFLTDDKVAALPCKRKAYFVWDCGGRGGRSSVRGLHVHVQPTGTKTYRYSFRLKGWKSAASYKLGRWPGMSLMEAREKAAAAAKHVEKGIDPRDADPANSDTFEATVREWHKREQVDRLKNVSADDNRDFLLHIFADLKHRPVGDITLQEISMILAKVVNSGRGASANRAHAHIKSFYTWCFEEGLVSVSPVKKRQPAPKPQARQRAWFTGQAADPVIKGVWDYAKRVGGDEGKLLKLLLITGKRRNAVRGMAWDQISDSWYWTPPKGTKNKRNNPIPLPKLAQRVLGRRPDGGGSVFDCRPSVVQINHTGKRLAKAVVADFFIHGIRHVVATKLSEQKVAPHIARLVLDHAPMTDAHSGYEHVDWTPEMLDALERWCAYIERVVAPAGVALFG
jgi:integrase